jgi:hypothetical protein
VHDLSGHERDMIAVGLAPRPEDHRRSVLQTKRFASCEPFSTPCLRTSKNAQKAKFAEIQFHALR